MRRTDTEQREGGPTGKCPAHAAVAGGRYIYTPTADKHKQE